MAAKQQQGQEKQQRAFDGKRAEQIVCTELLKLNIAPYIPLLDEGVDIVVKGKDNKFYELQVKANNAPTKENQLWFGFSGKLAVRNSLIYVLVDLINQRDDGKEAGNIWIVPSEYVNQHGTQNKSRFELHLNQSKSDEKIKDETGKKIKRLVYFENYKNNWSIFTKSE